MLTISYKYNYLREVRDARRWWLLAVTRPEEVRFSFFLEKVPLVKTKPAFIEVAVKSGIMTWEHSHRKKNDSTNLWVSLDVLTLSKCSFPNEEEYKVARKRENNFRCVFKNCEVWPSRCRRHHCRRLPRAYALRSSSTCNCNCNVLRRGCRCCAAALQRACVPIVEVTIATSKPD